MTRRRAVGCAAMAILALPLVALVVAYALSSNVCDEGPLLTASSGMSALIRCEYGTADVLRTAQLDVPTAGPGQVLVKVRAAAVNPLDWHFMRGTPYVMRLETGLRHPANIRLGVDFSGVVVGVGPGVTNVAMDDAVFGAHTGAFADFVVASEDEVVRKPATLSFIEAAAVPVAAVTALQALRDHARVGPGTRLLVNGASGGVGTFAVQIARHLGAEVTGVCSTRNLELVRSLGAVHVVDYTRDDFTRHSEQYDAILDNVGNRTLADVRRVLAPDGRYVVVGGGGPDDHRWMGPLSGVVHRWLRSRVGSQVLTTMLAEVTQEDLMYLQQLLAAGTVRSTIDRTYPFSEVTDAIRYVETGRARGKVVVTFE